MARSLLFYPPRNTLSYCHIYYYKVVETRFRQTAGNSNVRFFAVTLAEIAVTWICRYKLPRARISGTYEFVVFVTYHKCCDTFNKS